MTKEEAVKRARALLAEVLENQTPSLLTTASREGRPHAVWMGTFGSLNPGELLTLTDPQSRKVENIAVNPEVEWLMTSAEFAEVLYLRGKAALVTETAEQKAVWQLIPDKRRAYFLGHFTSGPGFGVIRTAVEEVELVVPQERWHERLEVDEVFPGAGAG